MDVKAKKLRREGYVVGNVFGREIEGSIPVKMPKTEVEKLLKTDHAKEVRSCWMSRVQPVRCTDQGS